MRALPKFCLAAIIAAFGFVLPPTRAGAAEPASSTAPPDRVQWAPPPSGGRVPFASDKPDVGRFDLAELRYAMEGTGALRLTGTLDADYNRTLAATDGMMQHAAIWFSYKFRVGDSLPMLDAMYKVGDTSGRSIDLKRVTDNDIVKELTNDTNLIVVPVGTSIRIVVHRGANRLDDTSTIDVNQIAGDGAAGGLRRAHISVTSATTPRELLARDNLTKSGVAVGDVVPLVLNCQLTVAKIIPPDEKHKIRGWVEFSPDLPKSKNAPDEK